MNTGSLVAFIISAVSILTACGSDSGGGSNPTPNPEPSLEDGPSAAGWIGNGLDGWQTIDTPTEISAIDYMSFNFSQSVCVDSEGNIYVADTLNHRISKWDKDGNAIGWIGGGTDEWKKGDAPSSGTDYQSFRFPSGVYVDDDGNIYVADTGNSRISKWKDISDTECEAIGWIGGGSDGWKKGDAPAYEIDYRSFDSPNDVYVDSGGNIYVADTDNNRISKWKDISDTECEAIGWIGGATNGWQTGEAPDAGTDYRSFYYPCSVNVDDGNIYVADCRNNRISKWKDISDTECEAIGWIGGATDGWQTGEAPGSGADYQSFKYPFGVYAAAGNIYVADSGNDRVSKWDDSTGMGIAQGWIGGGMDGWDTEDAPPYGKDYMSFDEPYSVYVDAGGNIYVAEYRNHRISKWDEDGNAVGWIGGGADGEWKTEITPCPYGSDHKSFNRPEGICVDTEGNIYVVERFNHRISKWDKDGNAIGWIGGGTDGWNTEGTPAYGTDYRSFADPRGVYVDAEGNIYVAEDLNNRVSKWDKDGNAIGWIGGGTDGWSTGDAPASGTDYQSFNGASDVYVDAGGNIYVVDWFNHRISKWNSSGIAQGWIGSGSDGWQTGNAPSAGQDYKSFNAPYCVYVDIEGNIFVGDDYNNRISKWNKDGEAQGWIGGGTDGWQTGLAPASGGSYRSFVMTFGLFVDAEGNIYVAEAFNDRISKWDKNGNAIGWIGSGSDGKWKTAYAPSAGKDYQSLDGPYDVYIDADGDFYVAEFYNHRISKWE